MKKTIYLAVFWVAVSSSFSDLFACSCIYLNKSNQIIFGRNHDYYNPSATIIFNPKNLIKSGIPFPEENIPSWKSVYSSITISSSGVGYANSGMNEKGLAIGHMALPEAIYPGKDDRPLILFNQWIQYMLDICANTNEVIEEAKKIRISEMSSGTHYFVGDSEGNAAIVEFLNGQLVVYTNKDMPYFLLCNDTYEKSLKDIKTYAGLGGDRIIPERGKEVEDAMAIGCININRFYEKDSKNIIQDAFDIQYAMRAPDSTQQYYATGAPASTPQYQAYGTQYSAVFDLTNMKLYFRTKENQTIREIDFYKFKSDCSVKAKLLDIQTTGTGNVNNLFINYSIEENRKAIDRFQSMEPNKLPEEMLDMNQMYIESFECEK